MLPSISLLQLLFWFLFSMPHMRTAAMVSLQCTYYIYIATHPAWMTVQEAGSSGEPDLSLAKATDIYRANETTSSQIKQFSTCSHSPKKAKSQQRADSRKKQCPRCGIRHIPAAMPSYWSQRRRSRYGYSGFGRSRFCPTHLVGFLIANNSRKIDLCRFSLD